MKTRPTDTEYAPHFSRYVAHVPEADVLSVLENQAVQLSQLTSQITADRETFRYAPEKWSIREVIGHLIDTERVFGYRAFCISRGERVSLPAFDENEYIRQSHYDDRPLGSQTVEFVVVRKSNVLFLRSLDDAAWEAVGTANNNRISVRALAYIMAGHVRHHVAILHERYDVGPGK
jgi:hypothetical protein